MKITCPSCAAEYNVPGELAAGRVVRCAKCGAEWAPTPAPADLAPPPPPPPAPAPEPAPLPTPDSPPERLAPISAARPAPRSLPLMLAWLGSLVVIVAALAAAFVFRGPIMHGWPPSQRVYGALGLHAAASPDVHGDVVK